MYTKNALFEFTNWLEQNLVTDDEEEKRQISAGVVHGLPGAKIDVSNLSIKSLINLLRYKIELIGCCDLGIYTKDAEKVIFAGIERWRVKYEHAIKYAPQTGEEEEQDKKRVSGWW